MELFAIAESGSWLCVGMLGDFAVAYVLGMFYPGYCHTRQVMSVLGNPRSPVRIVYNTWLVILGVLFLFSGADFYMEYGNVSKPLSVTGAVLLGIYGIGGCILSGLFSVKETKGLENLSEKIHGVGPRTSFTALLFVSLVAGLLFFGSGLLAKGILFLSFFVISLGLFVIFILSEKKRGVHIPWTPRLITY